MRATVVRIMWSYNIITLPQKVEYFAGDYIAELSFPVVLTHTKKGMFFYYCARHSNSSSIINLGSIIKLI